MGQPVKTEPAPYNSITLDPSIELRFLFLLYKGECAQLLLNSILAATSLFSEAPTLAEPIALSASEGLDSLVFALLPHLLALVLGSMSCRRGIHTRFL